MIDLHSHILPEIDNGSKSLEMSLKMAQIAVDEGTTHIACTPHHVVSPGLVDLHKRLTEVGYIPVLTHPERLSWME